MPRYSDIDSSKYVKKTYFIRKVLTRALGGCKVGFKREQFWQTRLIKFVNCLFCTITPNFEIIVKK